MRYRHHNIDCDLISDAGEPMALRLDTRYSVYPDRCTNVDGIRTALRRAAERLRPFHMNGDDATVWIFHGPVQDDEIPDSSEASYRITIDFDGDVIIEPLDYQAAMVLEAAGFEDEEGEDEEGDFEMQPSLEDYSISDSPPLGSRYSVGQFEGKHIGIFDTLAEAEQAIRSHAGEFRHDVWLVDDHGGFQIYSSFIWTGFADEEGGF